MAYKILVTGGAGYLGSVMVPKLLGLGHEVTVLDNFMFSPNSLAEVCADPKFDVIRADCRDEGVLKDAVKDKDIIIPLAALVGAPLCKRDYIGAETINRDAIQTLVDSISKEQRILMPVTNSGYGVGEQGKVCTEESPLRPISHYGVTKVQAEEIILKRENSVSLRLATVFGMAPRMRLDLLVNDFVYRAIHDRTIVVFEGHFKRNYIHVRDVANAFVHVIDNFDKMRGEAYNVGLSDANLSKLELCAEIQKVIPQLVYLEAPVGEDPDKRDYIVSNEKIEGTGWKPEHTLEMGIRELLKGFTILRNVRYGNVG